jgi:TPP-dependent pyruvate/acetoin dehydrogenase alpha subunit
MVNQAKKRVHSAAVNGKKGHSLISEAKFRQLYELTFLLRTATRRAPGTVPWLQGREAVLAGVMADLRSGDTLVSATAAWASESVRSRLPVSMRAPAATTMADLIVESLSGSMTDRLRNNAQATVIFGAATGSGAVPAEARALAAAARLPVLFVEDKPAKALPQQSNGKPGTDHTMPSIPVDSSDVIAIYRVAHESITRARQGSGPTRILCTRWQPTLSEPRNKSANDAVQRLEQWLVTRGLPVQEWREKIAGELDAGAEIGPASGATHEGRGTGSQPFPQANIELRRD